MQICQPTFGMRPHNNSSARKRPSDSAAVCGIQDRKSASRLLIGRLPQLSSIGVFESWPRIRATRERLRGLHARHSSAQRRPVRGQSAKGPGGTGFRSSNKAESSCLRSLSSSRRKASGAASASLGRSRS